MPLYRARAHTLRPPPHSAPLRPRPAPPPSHALPPQGEATEKMCGYEGQPGSNDGTGFFQTITALKCREIYEALSGAKVAA